MNRERKAIKSNEKDKSFSEGWLVEVIEYTDPYCTWCWGSEPILKKIKEVYGDQVKITFKMGGLVEDITNFYDPLNRIGGEGMFEQVAEHWKDASKRHGMPVDARVFQDLKGEFHSTYPANIAYKAAQIQNQELADKFLRRMREAAAAERQAIHMVKVQVELAKDVGLDAEKFLQALESGKAEKAFYEDLKECRDLGITGFPTFHIKNNHGEGIFLTGYQRFESFERIFKSLVGDALRRREMVATEENLMKFIEKYGKVATKEVAEVFDLEIEDAERLLATLERKGMVVSVKVGNGYFWLKGDKPFQRR
jgi:predicted DsbA family dithiol-disulfide isomerase